MIINTGGVYVDTCHRRLALRELTMADTDDLARVLCDPDAMRYDPHPFSLEEVHFGHCLWILGRNAKVIAEYIKNEIQEDIAADQISFTEYIKPFTVTRI